MNIYLETFGCTFNLADSEIMAGLLLEQENRMVARPEDADIIIVNTCYVKKPTEQKVVNRIIRLQQEFPQKNLIISGCMVEIDPEKLERIAHGSGWIGPHKIRHTPRVVKSVLEGETVRLTGFESTSKVGLPQIRTNQLIKIVQICEGCNGICSYCCTRIARGKLNSHPLDIIKKETTKAVNEGCVEIQLTAQDTAAYGKDNGTSLSELINEIININGNFKVRVGMMHPKSMMGAVDELITAFKNDKIYKFVHIPLQSGNDDVLSDMGRGHSVQEFKYMVSKFREEIPGISLATDIIVGYPTETPQAFQDTLQTINEIKPDFLHISKYHHRPGAISSSLEEIEHPEMKKRSKMLNELKSSVALQNNERLSLKNLKVLITGTGSKGGFIGRTDSYKTVIVDNAHLGSFVDVKITEVKGTYLKGEII